VQAWVWREAAWKRPDSPLVNRDLTGRPTLHLVASADAAALAGQLRLAALDDSDPAVPDSSDSAVPDASQDGEGEPQ